MDVLKRTDEHTHICTPLKRLMINENKKKRRRDEKKGEEHYGDERKERYHNEVTKQGRRYKVAKKVFKEDNRFSEYKTIHRPPGLVLLLSPYLNR